MLAALGEWGALRGGSISPRRLASHLTAPAFEEAVGEASVVSLSGLAASESGSLIVRLFRGLEGIKSSNAQLVAVSKTLYHLLPELIVPFDSKVTCGFFGWRSLPERVDESWLLEVYSTLSEVAESVGSDTLRPLGRPGWPLDPAVAQALRIGEARVVDFGLEGYRRSTGAAWYES